MYITRPLSSIGLENESTNDAECFCWYQETCAPENYPPENCSPENCTLWKLPSCENYPQDICSEKIAPLWKSPSEKITTRKIPSLLINHTNERKNKITKFFALKNAMQHNILIKITKAFFDTQMISQKNTGLRYFLYRMKKIQICQLSLYVTLWIWTKKQTVKCMH